MYYRIIGGKLIQLSDRHLEGYKPVINHEKPEEQDGYYIRTEYKIIDAEVHCFYYSEQNEEVLE